MNLLGRETPKDRLPVPFIEPNPLEGTLRLLQDWLHHVTCKVGEMNRRDSAGEMWIRDVGIVVKKQIARNSIGRVGIAELFEEHVAFWQPNPIQIWLDPLPWVEPAPLSQLGPLGI